MNLISKQEAMRNIHFPTNQTLLTKASVRLKFEELFYIQVQLVRKNLLHKQKFQGQPFKKVGDAFSSR